MLVLLGVQWQMQVKRWRIKTEEAVRSCISAMRADPPPHPCSTLRHPAALGNEPHLYLTTASLSLSSSTKTDTHTHPLSPLAQIWKLQSMPTISDNAATLLTKCPGPSCRAQPTHSSSSSPCTLPLSSPSTHGPLHGDRHFVRQVAARIIGLHPWPHRDTATRAGCMVEGMRGLEVAAVAATEG